MRRAVDEVIDIHTKQEIDRLKVDINLKCSQIAKLLGADQNKPITWTNPVFYWGADPKKRKEIKW